MNEITLRHINTILTLINSIKDQLTYEQKVGALGKRVSEVINYIINAFKTDDIKPLFKQAGWQVRSADNNYVGPFCRDQVEVDSIQDRGLYDPEMDMLVPLYEFIDYQIQDKTISAEQLKNPLTEEEILNLFLSFIKEKYGYTITDVSSVFWHSNFKDKFDFFKFGYNMAIDKPISAISEKKMITASEFENKVLLLEGVVFIIRSSPDILVEDYHYTERFPKNETVESFIKQRIVPHLNGLEFEIIDGYYTRYSGKHKSSELDYLQNIQNSYQGDTVCYMRINLASGLNSNDCSQPPVKPIN